MRTPLLALAALSGLAGHAAAADDALRAALADVDTLSLALAADPSLKVSVQTQFQYNVNLRDDDSTALADPDDDLTLGFQMRRTRVNLAGRVTDNIKGKVQVDFNSSTGDATLQEAFADWAVNDGLTLRIGQQKVHFLREYSVGTVKLLTADFSVQSQAFSQGYSQMVEAGFGGDNWRAWVAFSDGFSTNNTAFNSASEADFALTGRAEFKFGDADLSAFDQFTSWRGSTSGALVGAAVHYESGGDTNPSGPETDLFALTADFSWVGDGWNAFVAGVWHDSDDGTNSFDDYGLMAQAGVFLTDQFELFGRWDGVFVDEDRGAGVDDFHTATAGFNYYIVPESHAAKFTFNVMYYFDAVNNTGGVVSPSAGYNLLADSEDGQIGVTAQLQLLF
jgi:hypothetical protein